MKRISKYPHYILTWLPYVFIILLFLSFFLTRFDIDRYILHDKNLLIGFLLITSIILITGFVTKLTLLYKMWNSIQFGKPRTTPGKAVGYTFIPFYNYYWNFQIFEGFAKDYNSLIQANRLNLGKLDEKLFLKHCIIKCVEVVPCLNVLMIVIPVSEIFYCKVVSQIYIAVNNLNEIVIPSPQLLLNPILPQKSVAQTNFRLRTNAIPAEESGYYVECIHCRKILELDRSEIELQKFTCPNCYKLNNKLITVEVDN